MGKRYIKDHRRATALGFPYPQFISESNHFRITLYKDIFNEEFLQKMELSERQLKIIAYLKKQGHITSLIYQNITRVSKRTAIRELNELKNKKIITKEGTAGPGTLYRLKVP